MTKPPASVFVRFLLSGFLFFVLHFNAFAENDDKGRSLINMIDYIQRDYRNVWDENGVVNEFEMNEMKEFAHLSIDHFKAVNKQHAIADSSKIISRLSELRDSVESGASIDFVVSTCHFLKQRFMELELVPDAPDEWPDLVFGGQLYLTNCAPCHGEKGDGSGQLSPGLNPPPSNFLEAERSMNLSPFQVYNSISLGIDGTSMRAFEELSESDRWALSFYILSLGREEAEIQAERPVSLREASTKSNKELLDQFGADLDLNKVRNYRESTQQKSSLNKAKVLLAESMEAYREGSGEVAFNLALNAYLQGVEPVEQRIAASDANMVGRLEAAMMTFRTRVKEGASEEELELLMIQANEVLDEAENLISHQQKGLWFTTFLSASILIREGLEAFLIIISIIAILKSMDAKRAINWVHGGWIIALLFGASGWIFVDKLMSWDTSSRELMEGSLTLLAAVVLVFMGFWLHSKTEIGKWRKFVEERITALVTGNNLFGLAVFSFIVVFREAFESVIFLSTIAVDADGDYRGIWLGLIIATALVAFLSYSILKMFKKVNLRKVFLYTSAIIVVLAVILSGEGVHALQESGLVGVSSVSLNLRLPLLGIYPTFESLLAQLFTVALLVTLWLYNKKTSAKTI